MIKVQHRKLYASHYNDDSTGIGFEFKKMQMEIRHNEGHGSTYNVENINKIKKTKG
jgi:hypothetical protein